MHTRTRVVAGVVAVALSAAACSSASSGSGTTSTARQGTGPTATAGPGSSSTSSSTPAVSLPASQALATALTEALTAEHQAEATYSNMIATLGSVAPFTNVRDAETQHVTTLEALATTYGVTPPAGPFAGQASPSTRTAACQLGVTVETSMIALYDKLLPQVSAYSAVIKAFDNLRTAESTNQLPAFQHCA